MSTEQPKQYRILAVADEPSPLFYDYYTEGRLSGYDLILSAGDLSARYLEFLVTMANCPLLYVRGNHDDSLIEHPPEGCICIENQIYNWNGIRIMGLGGSYRYRNGENMYTEWQMRKRILRKWFALRRSGGIDILLTHAPARHLNDLETILHRGFVCFRELLERYQPRYFIHGHVHRNYEISIPQKSFFGDTVVINAFEACKFDYCQGIAEAVETICI